MVGWKVPFALLKIYGLYFCPLDFVLLVPLPSNMDGLKEDLHALDKTKYQAPMPCVYLNTTTWTMLAFAERACVLQKLRQRRQLPMIR